MELPFPFSRSPGAVSFLSVLTDDCVKRGRDYNAGGARYNNTYIQFVGLGRLTDSLCAVRQRCFGDDEAAVVRRFVSILDADFAGHETLRQRLVNKSPKYGNDNDSADDITVRISNTCFEELDASPTQKAASTGWKWCRRPVTSISAA